MKRLDASVRRVYVWDRLVRSLHWLLAMQVLAAYFWLAGGDRSHDLAGYSAALIVAIRLLWGLVGFDYARIGRFFPTPARLFAYLRCHRQAGGCAMVGHNPLGACMVMAMWLSVLGLAITGWLMGTDAFWGEQWLDQLHGVMANGLVACAALHVTMVVLISRRTRINLPKAMVTGYKVRGEAAAPFHDWVETPQGHRQPVTAPSSGLVSKQLPSAQ